MADVKILVDVWHQVVDGRRVRRTRGDIVDVTDELQYQWLVSAGIAEPVGDDGEVAPADEPAEAAASEAEDAEGDSEVADVVEKPLNTQSRAIWDTYARSVGVDPTKFKTKEELQAALK